jgi:hypothetical protein
MKLFSSSLTAGKYKVARSSVTRFFQDCQIFANKVRTSPNGVLRLSILWLFFKTSYGRNQFPYLACCCQSLFPQIPIFVVTNCDYTTYVTKMVTLGLFNERHVSLFCHSVSDEEKRLYDNNTGPMLLVTLISPDHW